MAAETAGATAEVLAAETAGVAVEVRPVVAAQAVIFDVFQPSDGTAYADHGKKKKTEE